MRCRASGELWRAWGLALLWALVFVTCTSWLPRAEAAESQWADKLDHGGFKGFPTYEQAYEMLNRWLAENSDVLSHEEIGRSFQDRPLDAYRLAAPRPVPADRPQILFTALMHAREPAGLTVVLYLVGHLLDLYRQREPLAVYLVENRDLWFIPFVNPDGYVLNQQTRSPQVRKNARPTCQNKMRSGVDINRNFPLAWKANTFPRCDEEYQGEAPFSEPESQALKNLCDRHQFKAAMNFHSFGSMLTHPYNWAPTQEKAKLDRPDDDVIYEELQSVFKFDKFGPAIRTVGYTAPGESDDWLYGAKGIISMSPEVGPESGGFFPPANSIAGIDSKNFARATHFAVKAGFQLGASWQFSSPGPSSGFVLDMVLRNSGLSASGGAALGMAVSGLTDGAAAPATVAVTCAGSSLPAEAFGGGTAGGAGGVALRMSSLPRRGQASVRLELSGAQPALSMLQVCVLERASATPVCQCSPSVRLASSSGLASVDFHSGLFVFADGPAPAERDLQVAQSLCKMAAASLQDGFGGAGAVPGPPPADPAAPVLPVPPASPTAGAGTAVTQSLPSTSTGGAIIEPLQPGLENPSAAGSDVDSSFARTALAGGGLAGLTTFAGVLAWLCRRHSASAREITEDEENVPIQAEKRASQPRVVGVALD